MWPLVTVWWVWLVGILVLGWLVSGKVSLVSKLVALNWLFGLVVWGFEPLALFESSNLVGLLPTDLRGTPKYYPSLGETQMATHSAVTTPPPLSSGGNRVTSGSSRVCSAGPHLSGEDVHAQLLVLSCYFSIVLPSRFFGFMGFLRFWEQAIP